MVRPVSDADGRQERRIDATIWVDADACPRVIKEILFRAANRARVRVVLVANQAVSVPRSPFIRSIQVASGIDVADNHIVQQAAGGDMVITADIPLAADLVAAGCMALNPRGELYTSDNIRQRLNMRDFMDTLRGSGIATGGPPPLGVRERQAFANQLDRWLATQGG